MLQRYVTICGRLSTVEEIDLLIEQGDTLYLVEIKLSANPKLSMTNAFDVPDRINGKKRGNGTIICNIPLS